MPRVEELGDCPLCFGRLMPLSVCGTCDSVVVRDGLEEIGPELACEDCEATNPTHFVCSACSARFPYTDVVREEGPTCPVCRAPVSPGAELCPSCSAVLPVAEAPGVRPKRRIRGEYSEDDVHEIARIPGVGRHRAEALCRAGYNALWKISRASEGELAGVRGIGTRTAAQIKEALRFLLLIGRPKGKEEVLSEEWECPLCGTVTSLFATRCRDCGAEYDDEELDEEFREEVKREEDKGLLAYYDVRLLENPNEVALHYARAALLLSMDRATEALTSLDRALELEPNDTRALQAKARALAAARGIGNAAQVLRESVRIPPSEEAGEAEEAVESVESLRRTFETDEALASLRSLVEGECPECGERQLPGAKECPVCGHRFAPDEPPPRREEDRLLEELERAIAGEEKAPPPPLEGEVPPDVVAKKRRMLDFLLKVPGVSRRAADATAGFFQNLEQIGLSDDESLANVPGVGAEEARQIKLAVDRFLGPAEEVAPRTPPEVPPERAGVTAPPAAPALRMPRPEAPRALHAMEITGRRGLINGRGLVNGRGRVNGLINGTGFINGGGLTDLRLPRRNLLPRYAVIAAALLMLLTIAVALVPSAPPGLAITIDGSFEDWQGVPAYADGTASANPNVQIGSVSVRIVDSFLFLRIQVAGIAFGDPADYDTMYAFLDTDGDAGTGYDLAEIGADYLVRVSGGGGAVEDARLLRFQGVDRADWMGWATAGRATAAASNSQVEAATSTNQFDTFDDRALRVRFAFDDNDGGTSHTAVPVGPALGALRVTQEGLVSTLVPGLQPFLRLQFEAIGTGAIVTVQQVRLTTTAGATFGSVPTNFDVRQGTPVVHTITVDPSGIPDGTVVLAGVEAVLVDRPHVVLGIEARAYMMQPPAVKRIDGLFDDWTNPVPDTDLDPVRRRALDIVSRDAATVGGEAFLYLRLAGVALEGPVIPDRLSRPPGGGGTGGDSVPAPPPPPRIGEDTVRFYIDTNATAGPGLAFGGLAADLLIEVRGRGGSVTNASVYRWSGPAWTWEATAATGLGANELEVGAPFPTIDFNGTQVVAVTADWSGVADKTDAERTRTRGGETDPPSPMDISGNGKFWLRDTNHASETACTYNKVASSTRGSGPLQTITLNTGESACWYVDSTSGATVPAGSWESLLDLSVSGADYDVRFEIWNKNTDTVAETIGTCLDQTAAGDDVQCLVSGVAEKILTSDQVVRLVLAHSFASGTVSVDYDDGDATGDSRLTLPIPEFSDLAVPAALVLAVVFVARRRPWRRSPWRRMGTRP